MLQSLKFDLSRVYPLVLLGNCLVFSQYFLVELLLGLLMEEKGEVTLGYLRYYYRFCLLFSSGATLSVHRQYAKNKQ